MHTSPHPASHPTPRAWIEALYDRHAPLIRQRARAILRHDADAEDAVQEVFTKAFAHADALADRQAPQAWLCRVTTNHCLNVIRDGRRRRELLDVAVAPAASDTAEDDLDTLLEATRFMERLPDDLRQVASCFYVEGMTQSEAAEALGVSRRTIGNRLRDVRAQAAAA